jgi:hypothetical protein
MCLGSAIPFALLASMWFATVRLYRDMTSPSKPRFVGVAILVPVMWYALTCLTLGGFTLVCGYVKLLFYSSWG